MVADGPYEAMPNSAEDAVSKDNAGLEETVLEVGLEPEKHGN